MSRRVALAGCGLLSGTVQALLPDLPSALAIAIAPLALVPLLVALGRANESSGASAGTRTGDALTAAVAYAIALGEIAIVPWLAPALESYFALSAPRALGLAAGMILVLALLHGAALGIALAWRPRRTGAFLVLWTAALWASWEALRLIVPPYFPAAALGASLDAAPALLQIASVTGIAGVTAVVVAAGAGIAALWARRAPRAARLRACATGIGLAIGALAWGTMRTPPVAGPSGTDAPSVLAVDLGATDVAASTLDAWIAATPTDRPLRPDLIVWPESALSVDLARDRAAWRTIDAFVARAGTTLATGGVSFELGRRGAPERFNSFHVIRPSHGMRSYHKRLLVPLAESWPSALGAPPAALEPVVAGRDLPVFDAAGTPFGALICFEIADAPSARALARRGARFLVNPTNDAWFRDATAPHLRWARVRAIETGRPVLRAANAGASALLDATGRDVELRGPSHATGVLEGRIPPAIDTVYTATGEVFLPSCLALVALGVALSMLGFTEPPDTRSRSCPA